MIRECVTSMSADSRSVFTFASQALLAVTPRCFGAVLDATFRYASELLDIAESELQDQRGPLNVTLVPSISSLRSKLEALRQNAHSGRR